MCSLALKLNHMARTSISSVTSSARFHLFGQGISTGLKAEEMGLLGLEKVRVLEHVAILT